MVNQINFYKTKEDKFGIEFKYQDNRKDLELKPVEDIGSLITIMSEDYGSDLYSKIKRSKFSAGFMTEEIELISKITKEYIKASDRIKSLENTIEIRDLEEYIQNKKSINTQIPKFNVKDISNELTKETLKPYLEQMSIYLKKMTELEQNITETNRRNYLKNKK